MNEQLQTLHTDFFTELEKVSSEEELKALQNEYLGKQGKLKAILAGVKDLPNEEKKTIGMKANELRDEFEVAIEQKSQELEDQAFASIEQDEAIDVTIGYPSKMTGHKHPISQTREILEDIFISMGYKIEDGPQIETEDLAFEKLNIPFNHPARDVWDTFWVSDDINKGKDIGDRLVLRPHTSPVQIRTMMTQELPIKMIAPGRVFRYEQEDARHTCNFYQLEGLVVGEGVTFGDLKWTLDTAMKSLLGNDTKTRFRPSIFPFTEPSAEVDVSCQICKGTGQTPLTKGGNTALQDGGIESKRCSMCSGTGWVELLGAGMVHPKVLEGVGIDPMKYSGFAFGIGIDRIAAQRFGVSSSRMFYQNELKLNEQF